MVLRLRSQLENDCYLRILYSYLSHIYTPIIQTLRYNVTDFSSK